MRRRVWRLCCGLSLLILASCSDEVSEPQGFAGLGASLDNAAEAKDFAQPGPGDRIRLPTDLGPHPAHRIEWWYLTANLTTAEGEPVGLQWTQFRQALEPRSPSETPPPPEEWPLHSVWMAHAALSTGAQHFFRERVARGDIGHAGAQAQPFSVWLDDWQLRETNEGAWRLQVHGDGWAYDVTLKPQRPAVRHGDEGFSAKSASGEGSLYFSYVDLAIEGTITIEGESHRVSGNGWFDREWSSQFLRSDQTGWDWMALQLDSGERIMAFRLREAGQAFTAGTWIGADGRVESLQSGDFSLDVLARRETPRAPVPTNWRLVIPGHDVDLEVTTWDGNFWNEGLYPYWEGPVRVAGTHAGKGYLELTGYDER